MQAHPGRQAQPTGPPGVLVNGVRELRAGGGVGEGGGGRGDAPGGQIDSTPKHRHTEKRASEARGVLPRGSAQEGAAPGQGARTQQYQY
jgi:hypothetical protein